MFEVVNARRRQIEALRLLRCQRTRRYYTSDGWSEDPCKAKTFSDEVEAVRHCLTHDLRNIELVLRAPGAAGADLFSTPIR